MRKIITYIFLVTFISLNLIWGKCNANSIILGVCGHNDRRRLTDYPYNNISIEDQFNIMKKNGINAYRTSCTNENCQKIISVAQATGITLIIVIDVKPSYKLSPEDNFNNGYKYGSEAAKNSRGGSNYYEISNEVDNWIGVSGHGLFRSNYDQEKLIKSEFFIKGIISGLKDNNTMTKVIVNDAGWCHVGFLKALWDDGVRWDITAFHWYSDMGDIDNSKCRNMNALEAHTQFGRPIWITELSARTTINNDKERGAWISRQISIIENNRNSKNIGAVFIYELFDEPGLANGEDKYGIYDIKRRKMKFDVTRWISSTND